MWFHSFKRIFLINLASRPDRRSGATAELRRLGVPFELLPAVAGKDNPFAQWYYRAILQQSNQNPPGAMGCHLSHALAWTHAILDAAVAPEDWVLVFEDDLAWHPLTTNEGIGSLLQEVPEDANMIRFTMASLAPNLGAVVQNGQLRRVSRNVFLQTAETASTLMYAVRKFVLPELLKWKFQRPIDLILVPKTYLTLPYETGVPEPNTKNYHFGVCYQCGSDSDVREVASTQAGT